MNKNWIIVWIIIASLLILLFSQINRNPKYIPSVHINKKVPKIKLLRLKKNKIVTIDSLAKNSAKIVHFWATWCMTCQAEHSELSTIIKSSSIPWIGVVYKDNIAQVKKWLNRVGYPYNYILFDIDGDLAINMGVYGTPETFLINKNGIIVFRYEGSMNKYVWNTKFAPIIRELKDA